MPSLPAPSSRPASPLTVQTVLTVLTVKDGLRLGLGWGSVLLTTVLARPLASPLPSAVLIGVLAAIIAVIVLCALGVVHQAEALARRLGDPYGTLVLTLSIVAIEVVLIAAVLLGPGDHATIARDSVSAVSMIILNLVMGVCLIAAAVARRRRRRRTSATDPGPGATHVPRANPRGAVVYLAMLAVLGTTAFALPALIGVDGAYSRAQELPIVILTILAYGAFLILQTGRGAAAFQEIPPDDDAAAAADDPDGTGDPDSSGDPAGARRPIREILVAHRGELIARAAVLIATALPIVLLSHSMADLLDDGLARLGAPAALGGVLIALIVFTPESITAVRAAVGGEMQRVVNLCHGALVSTVGLTIPTVLAISMLTGAHVVSAESPTMLALLGASLAMTALTLLARRPGALHGAVHLGLFGVYALILLG